MTDSTNQEAQENTPINKNRRRSWVGIIAFLAIILGIGSWFQLAHQQKKATHNYSQLQSSFHQTLTDTAQLTQTINALQTAVQSQNDQIQALNAAINRMEASGSGFELDLALQQADRYIQQAYLSVNFNHDKPGAIVLLQMADQRLASVVDTQVIPMRRVLADAILDLQSLPTIDYVGMLTKLSALRNQTATLPLFAVNTQNTILHASPQNETTTFNPKPLTTWQNAWQKTLETLHSLVIIRNRQSEITPLISQTQEAFLRQNLQLILQQAEWAVLEHNQSLYQFSLNQANEWIQHYFAENDQATTALQNDIAQLQKINLTPKIPDLKPLMDQIHALQLQINKNRTLIHRKLNLEEDGEATPAPQTSAPSISPSPTNVTTVPLVKPISTSGTTSKGILV